MPPIDLSNVSAHFAVERKQRITAIENSIGWGKPVATIPTLDGKNFATLTDTGVMVIRTPENMIITAFVANIRKATKVYKTAFNGARMPAALWNRIQENNSCGLFPDLIAA
jgi:hypothetical protein